MKRLSYLGIFRQRMVVAALTLGLIAVIVGVSIDIYLANAQTTIPSSTQALIQPLDPQLDVETVEQLESYEMITIENSRDFVRQFLNLQQAFQAESADSDETLSGVPDGSFATQGVIDSTQQSFPFDTEGEQTAEGGTDGAASEESNGEGTLPAEPTPEPTPEQNQ